jgi:hypothetical protein
LEILVARSDALLTHSHLYSLGTRTIQRFDFGKDRESCPNDFKSKLLDDIEAITWRRKGHERRAMLEELLKRADPSFKKRFDLQEEVGAQGRTPERRFSAITRKAMWLNDKVYYRIALAVNTSIACMWQAKLVVCMGTGKSMTECWSLG